MTAVVRGSTGETVILLPGDARQEVSEAALADLVKVATAVLSAAELRTVREVVPRLTIGDPGSRVSVDGMKLTVYRVVID